MPNSPRLSAASMVTLRSTTKMSPLVGLKSPDSRLTSVDFPAPFGPMTAWISPTANASDTSLTAARPPKRFDNAAVRIAMSAMITLVVYPRTILPESRFPFFGIMRRQNARNQSLKAARERQHDRDDDQALDQLPMLGQSFQRLFKSHHDDRAKERPRDAALAAEHDHHQRDRRLMPTEHFGRDEAELRGGEIAGEPGQRAGDDKRSEAHAINRESKRAGAALVVARGGKRAAERSAGDGVQQQNGQHGHCQHGPIEHARLVEIEHVDAEQHRL